jgi:isopenicillin N synthase-like dioxygenase
VDLRQTADRISVPYFFNPRLDARIPVLPLPAELAARAGPRVDPSDPIYTPYGRNAWKSRLRAHPDVAAAHGYVTGSAKVVTPGG